MSAEIQSHIGNLQTDQKNDPQPPLLHDRFSDYIQDLSNSAEKPPKGDPYLGAFYTAAHSLVGKNSEFGNLMAEVIDERPIPPKYFTNLLFRAVQYNQQFTQEKPFEKYPQDFDDPKAWETELESITADKEQRNELKKILLERDTNTTIYQRYAGGKVALNALFPNKALTVGDFGCGGNYGLPGLGRDLPFQEINDHTPNQVATTLLQRPVSLETGLAVDKNNPAGDEQRKWRTACSFYPAEITESTVEDVKRFEAQLAEAKNVTFVEGDLLDLEVNHREGTLPEGQLDAVVLSTMLYQLTPEAQLKVLDSALKSLNPDGVIIVQDFVKKNTTEESVTGLDFAVDWGDKYTYRTLVFGKRTGYDWKELLQWDNGRCKEVRPGEDFQEFVPPSTAA